MKKIALLVLLLALFLCAARVVRAGEPEVMRESMVSGALKGFAEAYLAVMDFDKDKKKFIGRLQSMKEENFTARYARFWSLMKEWPLPVRLKYGLTDHMTRDQLAGQIKTLTREDVRSLIQNVPDPIVCREFDKRLKRMSKQLRQAALPQQMQAVWEKVSAKLRKLQGEKKAPSPKRLQDQPGPEGKGN